MYIDCEILFKKRMTSRSVILSTKTKTELIALGATMGIHLKEHMKKDQLIAVVTSAMIRQKGKSKCMRGGVQQAQAANPPSGGVQQANTSMNYEATKVFFSTLMLNQPTLLMDILAKASLSDAQVSKIFKKVLNDYQDRKQTVYSSINNMRPKLLQTLSTIQMTSTINVGMLESFDSQVEAIRNDILKAIAIHEESGKAVAAFIQEELKNSSLPTYLDILNNLFTLSVVAVPQTNARQGTEPSQRTIHSMYISMPMDQKDARPYVYYRIMMIPKHRISSDSKFVKTRPSSYLKAIQSLAEADFNSDKHKNKLILLEAYLVETKDRVTFFKLDGEWFSAISVASALPTNPGALYQRIVDIFNRSKDMFLRRRIFFGPCAMLYSISRTITPWKAMLDDDELNHPTARITPFTQDENESMAFKITYEYNKNNTFVVWLYIRPKRLASLKKKQIDIGEQVFMLAKSKLSEDYDIEDDDVESERNVFWKETTEEQGWHLDMHTPEGISDGLENPAMNAILQNFVLGQDYLLYFAKFRDDSEYKVLR